MQTLTTYPASPQDYDFLYRLHYLGFYEYVNQIWGTLAAEFEAAFRSEFEHPNRQVVCLEETPIGSLVVEEHCDSFFLDYIAILPEYQKQGFGTALIRTVINDAARQKKCVRLHVLKVNPAQGLYRRLGFRVYGEDPYRYYMELP